MNPQRVQRNRRKAQPGIPAGALYVGRGSSWGNPYKIVATQGRITVVALDERGKETWYQWGGFVDRRDAAVFAVELYARFLLAAMQRDPTVRDRYLVPLAGRDLCCWCAADAPCHADIPLILANGGGPEHIRRYLTQVRGDRNASSAVTALLAEITEGPSAR